MKLNVYSILLAILGQGILIAGFILFRGNCPDNILWLNIIVASIVFWLMGWSFGLEPMNLADRSSRKAGGLGIKWVTTLTYSICAVGFMAVCGAMGYGEESVPFKWQLIIQAGLLFLLLLGLLASGNATRKAAETHRRESATRRGKEDIRFALTDLAREAESANGLPAEIASRLRRLAEDTRYLSPSATQEAYNADNRIFAIANQLRPTLSIYNRNAPMNASEINRLLDLLTRELNERKRLAD